MRGIILAGGSVTSGNVGTVFVRSNMLTQAVLTTALTSSATLTAAQVITKYLKSTPGGAANAALMLVSAGLAAAYGAQGIRVNAINPGLTLTDRLQEGMAADARLKGISTEEAMAQAVGKIPLGRMAEPEEMANAVLFLASSKASYVTGICMSMDGALTPIVV